MSSSFCLSAAVILACVISLGILGPACRQGAATAGAEATKKETLTLDKRHNGQTVHVETGSKLEIRLEGNPTTGYSWQISALTGSSVVQNGSVEYLPEAHILPLVGSGGTFVVRLQAKQAGKSTIKLDYLRPWEKGRAPADRFSVNVQVQ